jgi:hypothetical protein
MRRVFPVLLGLALVFGLLQACGDDEAAEEAGVNPFLDDQSNMSKEDTQYYNPDGTEVEVDIEGDVDAPAYKKGDAPAILGQFALTYLRKRGDFYLESLAEDASSDDRVEWRVDNTWLTAAEAESVDSAKLTHFRIRGINAVLLLNASNGLTLGKQFLARVPVKPFSIMADAGDKCADKDDGHITLDQSVYWYMWDPDKSACPKELQQDMLITVSKLLPEGRIAYPEYDQLVADGKVTAVVMFGKIGDGDIEKDTGMYGFNEMARWLKDAKYVEATSAPVGRRFSKTIGSVVFEIDLYSPKDFSGLSDYAHYDNFERAIREHEIVAYDGHSMLGASDFWAKPDYPDNYQIFLYGGCLGYEYYITPILKGKGGWDKVDILSSVVEVSVGANEFAGPFLAKMEWALGHNFNVSWKDMIVAIRKRVGDSTFGVCGVRENCFSPAGSLCGQPLPETGVEKRFDQQEGADIPDHDETGIISTLEVQDEAVAVSVTLELDIDHTYVGDLLIVLEHDGTEVKVWENAGGQTTNIREKFVLPDFQGKGVKGVWKLRVADVWEQDSGRLNSWALVMVLPE